METLHPFDPEKRNSVIKMGRRCGETRKLRVATLTFRQVRVQHCLQTQKKTNTIRILRRKRTWEQERQRAPSDQWTEEIRCRLEQIGRKERAVASLVH